MNVVAPNFVITDKGNQVASVATPTGPWIHIDSFSIGSAYGYQAQRSDLGLNGIELYKGKPLSYSNVGDNTINIKCVVASDAGPFNFGEVALWLADGTLYAKAVFSDPQTKYSSLGTNVLNTFTFNCMLKLEQSIAVFKIDTAMQVPPAVWEVDCWSDIYPAGASANPDIPTIMCREPNYWGEYSLLLNQESIWRIGSSSYEILENLADNSTIFPVAAASATWIEVAQSKLPAKVAGNYGNRGYVILTPDGYYRSVKNVVTSGQNYRLNLNTSNDGTYNNTPLPVAPAVGSSVTVYMQHQINTISWAQIQDPPPPTPAPPPAGPGTPGMVYPGDGVDIVNGKLSVHGLLHGPNATNAGRALTAGDNLDDLNLQSGLYTVSGSQYGWPANLPANVDGVLHNVNTLDPQNSIRVQTFYPAGAGNGDWGTGANGIPVYWRSFQPYYPGVTNAHWMPWFTLSSPGKADPSAPTGGLVYIGDTTGQGTLSFVAPANGVCMLTNRGTYGDAQNQIYCYVNGNQVSYSYQGNGKYGGRGDAMCFGFPKGATVRIDHQWSSEGGPGSPVWATYFG